MIDGVQLFPLRRIQDPRGDVLHMLRRDAPYFERFGEVYFSEIRPGAVKAWKRHQRMTQNLCVPVGSVRFVLYDDRPQSPTCGRIDVHEIGGNAYALLRIPPLIWYGFENPAHETGALIANCVDEPHDPSEVDRRSFDDPTFPWAWGKPT